MKVIINLCYGGWGISEQALKLFREETGDFTITCNCEDRRSDPILVGIVEQLGEWANGFWASLVVAEVPEGYDFWIEEYDGYETLHFTVNEGYLRELIRNGDEDAIVNYVMNAR